MSRLRRGGRVGGMVALLVAGGGCDGDGGSLTPTPLPLVLTTEYRGLEVRLELIEFVRDEGSSFEFRAEMEGRSWRRRGESAVIHTPAFINFPERRLRPSPNSEWRGGGSPVMTTLRALRRGLLYEPFLWTAPAEQWLRVFGGHLRLLPESPGSKVGALGL